jgi:hypothetical protein
MRIDPVAPWLAMDLTLNWRNHATLAQGVHEPANSRKTEPDLVIEASIDCPNPIASTAQFERVD